MNWVANRHVITNSMHIGHIRYTSALLNIKIQCPHDFYHPTYYKIKYKIVYDNTVCLEKLGWCFSSMVTYFFLAYSK